MGAPVQIQTHRKKCTLICFFFFRKYLSCALLRLPSAFGPGAVEISVGFACTYLLYTRIIYIYGISKCGSSLKI